MLNSWAICTQYPLMPPHAHGSAAEEQRAHKHRYDWWWEYSVPDGNVYRWYCWGRAFRNGQWGTWWEVYCWSDRDVLAPLCQQLMEKGVAEDLIDGAGGRMAGNGDVSLTTPVLCAQIQEAQNSQVEVYVHVFQICSIQVELVRLWRCWWQRI